MRADDVLVIIDVQNDFLVHGSLGVPDGDAVIDPINRTAQLFANVVMTQDWHPEDSISFASTHPGTKPFDTLELPYGPNTLWPDHCIWDTWGAAFASELSVPHCQGVIRKGYRREVDSYSGFQEADRRTKTGLEGYLRERGISRLFLAGLATDFCVLWTAVDGTAAGFETWVIEDLCRAIDTNGSLDVAWATMAEAGVRRTHSAHLR